MKTTFLIFTLLFVVTNVHASQASPKDALRHRAQEKTVEAHVKRDMAMTRGDDIALRNQPICCCEPDSCCGKLTIKCCGNNPECPLAKCDVDLFVVSCVAVVHLTHALKVYMQCQESMEPADKQ